jgi:hypothetical protein
MMCVRPTSWWEKRQMGESGLCEVEGMSGFLDVDSVFEGTVLHVSLVWNCVNESGTLLDHR